MFGYLCIVVFVTLQTVSAAPAEPGEVAAGKRIYERLCVGCHGQDGRGGSMARMLAVAPRNLADSAYMQGRQVAQLFHVIKDGGAGSGLSTAMPAFGSQLTEQEIWDTVAYVRTLATVGDRTADPAPTEATTAGAKTTSLRMAYLRLSLWPEYDDPRVLVMVRGEMMPANAFPTYITLPIPKQAELIGAGLISAQNELLLHPHQVLPGETKDMLELNLPAPRFFVELYYDPFTTRRGEKRFTFAFSVPYPVEQLDVDIQKPYEASNFVTEPAAMSRDADDRGGMYHRFSYRDLQAGETKSFTVSYSKTSDQPSVPKSQPPASAVAPLSPMNKTLVAFELLAGVTVLYAGGMFFWKGYWRRREPVPSAPHLANAASAVSVLSPGPNFCITCGRKLQPEYAFCPGCGRSLLGA